MEQSRNIKSDLISVLTRSEHGDLAAYSKPVKEAVKADPEFLAHLIAWNAKEGSIRDSQVALPVFSLAEPAFPRGLTENSLAHIAMLDPRNFLRAVCTAKGLGVGGEGRSFPRLVEQYVRFRESNYGLWESAFVAHRKSMLELYTRWHIKPGNDVFSRAIAKHIYPPGSTLSIIQKLPTMSAQEALGFALQRKIPMKVLIGALREKLKDTDALLAVINAMTPTELTTNAKMLNKMGVKNNPVLLDAYRDALRRAKEKAPSQALMKAGVAAKALEGTEIGKDLERLQQAQVQSVQLKGRWAIFGDRSRSMQTAIEAARQLAAGLSSMVGDDVHLVFFNTEPRYFNATGKTLHQIEHETTYMTADGGTSIGVAMDYLLKMRIEVDGISVVSDGAENQAPMFTPVYKRYCDVMGKEIPVYLYWMHCDQPHPTYNNPDALRLNMEAADRRLTIFDLRGGFDHYSLLNAAKTMRANQYSLVQEIMDTPLKILEQVFSQEARYANAGAAA